MERLRVYRFTATLTAKMAAKQPSQRKDAPSPQKARTILRDGTVHGQPLTTKQKGYFGAVAAKAKGK